jgi:hypothetical protein
LELDKGDPAGVANKKSTEKVDAGVGAGAVGGTTGIGIVGHDSPAEAEPPSPPTGAEDLKEVLVQAERRGQGALGNGGNGDKRGPEGRNILHGT